MSLVSPTRVYVNTKVKGKQIRCLLYSGCKRSVIAWSLVSDLSLTRLNNILLAANGMDLPVVGDADLHFTVFTIDGHKFVAHICVSPAVDELLLKSYRLVEIKCKWDFAEGIICAGDCLICHTVSLNVKIQFVL